ncbi:MAG: hypothetical protein ABI458_06810, partial [Chloroflexota bacterium]
MADLEVTPTARPSRARFVAATMIAVLLFGVLAGRLFQLQVVDGALYAAQAAAARTIETPIRAPRGLIFDREGRPIAVNIPSWTLYVRPADLPSAKAALDIVLARASELSGVGLTTLVDRLDAFRGSPFELVPLATDIGREAALLIAE